MNLEEAQIAFDKFLEGVDEYHVADFLNYIQRRWFVRECSGQKPAFAYGKLHAIAQDIQALLPLNAICSSEKIVQPLQGENSNCDPKHTVHMDAFLYDNYELDELERENKISKYYCEDCSSHKVAPLTFISHSASKERIGFIFQSLLPYLDEEKILLDVGSRLGAVLYGAYVYTDAKKIIGVEMNKDLCDIQQTIVAKHNFGDRIEIVCDDICNQADVVKNSDVIILNNVFEFFLTEDQQAKSWKFLRSHITKPKTMLVTIPSLEKSLEHLKVDIDITKWVRRFPVKDPLTMLSINEQVELSEVCMYEVL